MSTEQNQGTEVKKSRGRKKIDLSTAKVADAALPAPRSVYEMIGYRPSSSYKTNDFDQYKKSLQAMHLPELQEHAYQVGVLPTSERLTTIKRLEEKFLRESKRFVAPNIQTTSTRR